MITRMAEGARLHLHLHLHFCKDRLQMSHIMTKAEEKLAPCIFMPRSTEGKSGGWD
jgi:hypothetical protein